MGYEIKAEKKLVISLNLTEIAEGLANGDNLDQATFLNVFSYTLQNYCPDEHRLNMQISSIAEFLTEDGTNFIKDLYEFVVLKERNES